MLIPKVNSTSNSTVEFTLGINVNYFYGKHIYNVETYF